MGRMICFALFALSGLTLAAGLARAETVTTGPYADQVSENLAKLKSDSPTERAGAAESLGFLRAYTAEADLVRRLHDLSTEVRRQAAMALAWCGGRTAVGSLLASLDDPDWEYGIEQGALQDLAHYWAEQYDWRKHEASLNRFPQFKTEIDGQTIHYLHARSPIPDATPLIVTHGWPGSIVEFEHVIEPLTATATDPTLRDGVLPGAAKRRAAGLGA